MLVQKQFNLFGDAFKTIVKNINKNKKNLYSTDQKAKL